jgi:hypothetical protein
MHWPPWLGTAPSLVAESLREIADPLAAWLRVGPARPAPSVAAALARAMLPDEAQDAPPPWLRADQTLSFQRAVAAARRFGGAILADPVGTGKTYIGIAAALALLCWRTSSTPSRTWARRMVALSAGWRRAQSPHQPASWHLPRGPAMHQHGWWRTGEPDGQSTPRPPGR